MRHNFTKQSATLDLSGDDTSAEIDAVSFGFGMVQLSWTGTPTGNFILQISAGTDSNDSTDTDIWTDIDTQAAGGAAGTHAFLLNVVHGRKYRVFFDSTSGSGTATVKSFLKASEIG